MVLAGSKDAKNSIPSFFEWVQQPDLQSKVHEEAISPSDLAVILYTSGSTGIPKGVMLSQQALFNSGLLAAKHFNWCFNEIFMNLGDLHSMSGLRNSCLAPLHVGASFVIATSDERNSVLLLLGLVQRLGVHYLGVAPTVIRQMNIIYSESRKNQVETLKAVLCTGGPLAKDQLAGFYSKYGKPVLNYYGLTETAGLCAGHDFETFNPEDNSIGRATGAELVILPDPSASREEGTGELLVKSQNLMSGYFNREKETEQVLKNGYFHTGDIVRKRGDGCYELLGRKRNIVKNVRSELIYLEEIDAALESHPRVKECCCCGYARFEEDEKIVAFVVIQGESNHPMQDIIDQIRKYLIGKVGKHRAPWCYYPEESLPRNSAGKIQRQIIKEKLHGYIQSHRKGYF
jgi:acyl-coenzyme A synthetase/AMP-(fatty) acid ligase